MKTLTLQDINPFLPYGLKVKSKYDTIYEVVIELNSVANTTTIGEVFENEDKPILYHISWLTKEIMLPGYDEPEIPIVILAKIAGQHPRNYIVNSFGIRWKSSANVTIYFEWMPNLKAFMLSKTETDKPVRENFVIPSQYDLFKKLAELKFNFNGISDDLVEYVTETFNPYVK